MAETVLFESQTVEGFSNGFVEIYPAPFVLVVGETYRVVWDGVEHTLVAFDTDGISTLADITLDENGNITNWTFRIMYASPALTGTDGGGVAMGAYDLTAESHTVAVYQVVADDAGDEEEGYGKQAAVILNYSRNPVYYPSVPKVWLTHPDSTEEAPVLVPYTYGEAVSKTVEPDFTDGDMAVPIGEGELVTELTVVKPEELVPENIRAGKTIAGIDGSYAGAEGAPLEVALDFSGGDTMEFTPEEGVAYSRVTIPKPENLTPENIAEGLDIAGVVGTLAAGGGGDIDALLDGSITEIHSDVLTIYATTLVDLKALEIVDFPKATTVYPGSYYSFSGFLYGSKNVKRVNVPLAVPTKSFQLGSQQNNTVLEEYIFPGYFYTGTVTNNAFNGCTALERVDLAGIVTPGSFMFKGCSSLKTVTLTNATKIQNQQFYLCTSLEKVDFPAVTSIDIHAFYGCSALKTLILRSESVVTASATNMLMATPIESGTGHIYVPSALVASYKTASYWSTYSAQFRAIEDYPDICG